jgi:hypothetical protein
MGLLASLLPFAIQALQAGVAVAPVIRDALGKTAAPAGAETDSIEAFAAKALQHVPTAIAAGVATSQIVQVLNDANDAIRQMIAESRGPTDAEWNAQDVRIKALEDELDAAGKIPGSTEA